MPWLNMVVGVIGAAIGRPGPKAPVTMLIDEAPALGYMPDLRGIYGAIPQGRFAGLAVHPNLCGRRPGRNCTATPA